MNRDEIMNMQPGRKMDVLVAEKVLGKLITHVEFQYRDNEKGFDLVPEYSTDISAAWEVVEKMHANRFLFDTSITVGAGYIVRFFNRDKERFYTAPYIKTAPEAICKAALLSLIQEDTP